MNGAYTDEFNLNASSAEVRRRQLYHAVTGNESVFTAFAAANTQKLEVERRRKDENLQSLARMVLASREQIASFRSDLVKFDEQRIELLAKTEQELLEIRGKLKRIRDSAPEMTMPDGSRRKIFRDGDQVRDESGGVISTELVDARTVSSNRQNWNEFTDLVRRDSVVTARREDLLKLGDDISRADKLATDGKMSPEEMDKFRTETEKRLAALEHPVAKAEGKLSVTGEKTFQTGISPTSQFADATAILKLETPKAADAKVTPPSPAASAPGPM